MGPDGLTTSSVVGLVFAGIAILAAIVGVIMQDDALRYADLGEVPDTGGDGLAGIMGGPFETKNAFNRDLRSHYRRIAAGLSMMANLILLVSVVAGVLASLTSIVIVAWVLGFMWVIAAVVAVQFVLDRRRKFRGRQEALEQRRLEFNRKSREGMTKTMGLEYTEAALHPIPPLKRLFW